MRNGKAAKQGKKAEKMGAGRLPADNGGKDAVVREALAVVRSWPKWMLVGTDNDWERQRIPSARG